MMRLVILISVFSVVNSQKLFGPFVVEPTNVDHPEPENDVVHYHFQLLSKGRGKKEVNAKFEVLRKVEDLKVSGALWKKKGDTKAGEYYQTYPRTPLKSLCEDSFQIFKKSFTGILNPDDCSLEKGSYKLIDYSLEDELRNKVGDSTFYGDFKGRLFLTEGTTNQDIIVFEVYWTVLPPEEAAANKKSKFASKKKP